MWPCVANVSEICCFQLARGLREVAACSETRVMCPRPSRFTSWALGSNRLSGTPAWVPGHQTGLSVRLWALHARLPVCPGLRKSGPQPRVLPDSWLLRAQTLQQKLHSTPSTVTQKCDSNPGLSASFRKFTKGPNWTGEATGCRTRLISQKERGGDMRRRDVSRSQLDLIQTKPTT